MIKKLVLLGVLGFLFVANPSLNDCLKFAEERIAEEQSSVRAGWSGVSKVTGLNWLSKQAGFGNYKFCRKNFYLFSVYSVTNAKLLDSSQPIAVAFGVAGQIYGRRIPADNESGGVLLKSAGPLVGTLSFKECGDFHKEGDLTGS